MTKVVVLLTYDLKTPPGLQSQFKEEMINLKWKYSDGGKDLPETTCYATYKDPATKQGAIDATKKDLKKVTEILLKADKTFKIERFLSFAMDEAHFKASVMDLG